MDIWGLKAKEQSILNAISRQNEINAMLSSSLSEIKQLQQDLKARMEGIEERTMGLEEDQREKYTRNVELAARAREAKVQQAFTREEIISNLATEFAVPPETVKALAKQLNVPETLLPLAGAYLRAHPEILMKIKEKIGLGALIQASPSDSASAPSPAASPPQRPARPSEPPAP